MFEWDEEKNKKNRDKHGVDFHDAVEVFAGKAVSYDDNRADYGEKR